ncbi:hypothetical protein [Actinoplanes aureus]|uniref:Uncharacterized protein n=1 Tax=Actinoplanes aureus TaxID=2792083 RepID=A0A931CJX1_9ACTN|nr:hypothetical protein [Actinoplanes aureus]MBG0566305.1 hypothetical protein [Actinoplanes aureus]
MRQVAEPVGRTSKRRTLVWSSVLALLLVGLVGAASYFFVQLTDIPPSAAKPPAGPPPSFPVEGGASGPRAATDPVRTTDDLELVCENWYYPGAPKFRGAAPHPVLISVRDQLEVTYRSVRTLNQTAYAGSAAKRKAWAPKPAQTQLVACLDLVGGGPKLRDCKVEDPDPLVLPMKQGRYRLTVYEVATREKVAESNLIGKDESCPWVAMTGPDRTLHSTVDDDQLYRVLRKRVEG